MAIRSSGFRCAALLALGLMTACGEKTDLDAPVTVSQASSQLEQAFEGTPPATQQQVKTAVQALGNADYERAYVSLQLVQAAPDLTYPQAVAARKAMHSLQERLARGVVAGDPSALKAAEAIKRMQR